MCRIVSKKSQPDYQLRSQLNNDIESTCLPEKSAYFNVLRKNFFFGENEESWKERMFFQVVFLRKRMKLHTFCVLRC